MARVKTHGKKGDYMKKPFAFEEDGETYTLRDSVELLALAICENILNEEQRATEIMRKCKILDSLSNALIAIKN